MKLYKKNKAKMFIIIKGQCSLAMKTKIESNKEYKTIEEQNDVIKLIKLIKSLSHANIDVKYEYWSLSNAMVKLHHVKQELNESLMVYYKKFINLVEIAEVQHGPIVPIDLARKDIDYRNENKREQVLLKARGKYLACVFMKSIDCKYYGTCIKELNKPAELWEHQDQREMSLKNSSLTKNGYVWEIGEKIGIFFTFSPQRSAWMENPMATSEL